MITIPVNVRLAAFSFSTKSQHKLIMSCKPTVLDRRALLPELVFLRKPMRPLASPRSRSSLSYVLGSLLPPTAQEHACAPGWKGQRLRQGGRGGWGGCGGGGDKNIKVGVPKTMGFLSPFLVRRGAGGNARMFLEAFCHQRPKSTLAHLDFGERFRISLACPVPWPFYPFKKHVIFASARIVVLRSGLECNYEKIMPVAQT